MGKRIAVGVVVALLVGSLVSLQAQTDYGSPGLGALEGLRRALDRQEEQRRQDEQERLAWERLALEERLVRLREQQAAPATPPASAPAETQSEKVQYVLVTRAQLAELVTYLHDAGLSDDQLRAVVLMLAE